MSRDLTVMSRESIVESREPKSGHLTFSGVLWLLAVFCFTQSFASAAYGQDAQQTGKIVLNLEQCIKKAVEISPEIGETVYEKDVYQSKKMQADAAAYPQIELLAITAPSPAAKKEHLFSTDKKSTTFNGVFGSADVTLIQPIYTFGKISGYKEAASSGVKVAKAGIEKKTADIVLRTKELYYSLLLARDMKNLALEIKDELVRSVKKADEQIKKGSPWADEVNLFKLNAFLGEVEKNLNEINKGIALAKDALITSMGLPKDAEFDIAETSITPEDRMPEALGFYLKNAVELRPEFIQLKEGLIARNALVDVEKSNYYPHLFVGLKGSVSGASNRDTIYNPYINDFFNHSYGAAFLGLKWGFDFGITKGRVKESEAEYNKIAEKKRFADEAIPFQIRKAYLDFEEAKKNEVETEKAYRNARKWLVSAAANFDLGIVEAKEVADSAVAYAQMKADYLRSIYNQRLSYANILYATGMDK